MSRLQAKQSDAKTCTAQHSGKDIIVPFVNSSISIQELRSKLSYDPKTGIFIWKVNAAKNVPAGREAGCVKACRPNKHGVPSPYRYIRIGHEIPAQRVAWAIHYGAWPLCKIMFNDGDTLNLRIENLREANSLAGKYDHSDSGQRSAYMKAHREAYPLAWKDSHLRSAFGITLADYGKMAVAQDNKCAICRKKETATRNGKVKALAVDHDHATGEIRELLCVACNTGIGKFYEDRSLMLAAVRYLDKHSGASVPVVLKEVT